jgi:hypothetical protein
MHKFIYNKKKIICLVQEILYIYKNKKNKKINIFYF